jgi:hypothetical protein
MKPSGYWQDVGNVKKELDAFNLAHGMPGQMPKEGDLKARGFGSLAHAVHQHGGFKQFALAHGYTTFRKPNDYYKEFEVLTRELLDWISRSGTPGIMPTAQQLREADPPRHDLVSAIDKHGGFPSVAEKALLKMSHSKKPDGYYDDVTNLAREVYAFADGNNLHGKMPTPGQLAKAGQTGLIKAIVSHGRFWRVARDLGLAPNRKARDYWTEETVDLEVKEYMKLVELERTMPTDYEIRAAKRADLAVAISRYGGGMVAVAARLGLGTRASKRDRYWDDESTIARELLQFIDEHGSPGRMPTQSALSKADRNDLAIAISRYGGGWAKMSSLLGLELNEMPKDHWTNLANVKAAILALNERRGRPGEMPTKTDLDLAGEFSLGAVVEKLGGYPAVAAMFGLSSARISLWPRSREELILAHELMVFVNIDLEAHKVDAGGKTRDVDIIIPACKLIVEFDSSHWHKETTDKDREKTDLLLNSGWNVLRVREEPLQRIRPTDILVRKGQHKEMCNRVLLALQQTHGVRLEGLDHYLLQRDLRNIGACERYIAEILRTKRGEVNEQ